MSTDAVRTPEEWSLKRSEGAGPFTTRASWDLPDGRSAVWSSRAARKRGEIRLSSEDAEAGERALAEPALAKRLLRLNWIAAIAFTIGGSLFALGAALSQTGRTSYMAISTVYLVGGVFFSTGGYASLLQAINAPRTLSSDGSLGGERWRWWSYEPLRIEWLGTFVLFAGTIVFGINLIDSFLQGLSIQQQDRLIWGPDLIGCILFLVSGHLAMVEVCHGRPRLLPRRLEWWIVVVNQLGSILFFISAMSAYIRPETSEQINTAISNWGTFGGAALFAVGGVLQAFERPSKE